MTPRNLSIKAVVGTLALALGAVAAAAGAQNEEPIPVMEGITVTAPRVVQKKVQVGRREWVTEMSARVSYADLDLVKAEDLRTMEGRIAEAAARICKQLSSLHPDGRPGVDVCTHRAIDGAMVQVHEVARMRAENLAPAE
jgi:UrcA family protein